MATSKPDTARSVIHTTAAAIERGDVDWRRGGVSILFTFGIAWMVGAAVYVTGGISPDSPTLLPGIPLWYGLVATGYMFAPALANGLTRLLTNEGRDGLYLRPRLRRNWHWWGLAWLDPPVLIYLGAGLFFALFPQFFDPTLTVVTQRSF